MLFLRRTSGPIYYYTKGANFRFLRRSSDEIQETHIGVDDIVVDDYESVLWRLRALYGLKNTKGTKSLALGGHQAIYAESARKGPDYAKNVWGFEIIEYPVAKLEERLAQARKDQKRTDEAERQVTDLLAQPSVTLVTQRKFVFNTILARNVVREVMRETGATSVGVARCMNALIPVLDTPPCLMLSLLNDEGYVAFCHNDFAQTPPGVLLRWIAGRPVFLANAYFPYQGLWTVAHCSSPR
jgi:L-fucose isomerase-like protein